MEDTDLSEAIESTEKFMVACIDAALAAQNATLAAESMDLGICYIGGIRNDLPASVRDPEYSSSGYSVIRSCSGYPKIVPIKSLVCHKQIYTMKMAISRINRSL